MRITILDRQFTARMITTYIRVCIALVGVVVLVDLLATRQREIERYDVPWTVVAQYYLAFGPSVLFKFQAAAVAMLITGLIVIGNAAQHNEVTAAIASGISLYRLLRAPIIVALLLAVGVFFLSDTLGAKAFAGYHRLDREFFSRFDQDRRDGVSWTNLSGDWTAHVGQFNREALTGQEVIIHDIQDGRVQDIRADRIFWEPARSEWLLEDGRWFTFDPVTNEERTERITQGPAPFHETPDQLFSLETPPGAKSAGQLRRDLIAAEGLGMPTAAQWVDYHTKFAQPALIFVMLLLAIPFALLVRRGGIAISFGVAIGIGIAYVFCFFIFTGLGQIQQLPPLIAAWAANLLFLAGALYLLWKTPT
jgi:lipopolysaccharide export system permease protein